MPHKRALHLTHTLRDVLTLTPTLTLTLILTLILTLTLTPTLTPDAELDELIEMLERERGLRKKPRPDP